MYLFKRGLLPNHFRDMFTLASQIHSHNTRNSSLFYTPHCRNNFRKFSIRFQGFKFFNSLSREIQNRESISLFGKRLKNTFFLSQIYSLSSYTLVCYTVVFSVVTQRFSPLTAAENRTTFLSRD